MEMRKLSGQDLFPVLTLFSKLGIKDMLKAFFKKQADATEKASAKKKKPEKAETKKDDDEMADLGMDFVAELMEVALGNIERGKDDINRLLASLCGTTVKDIQELEIDIYGELIINFFRKPELANFIKSISSFLSK